MRKRSSLLSTRKPKYNLPLISTLYPSFFLGFPHPDRRLHPCLVLHPPKLYPHRRSRLRLSHGFITSALYSYFRHPTYMSIGMSIFHDLWLHFLESGCSRACGMAMVVRVGWALHIALAVSLEVSLGRRVAVEDKMLRNEFREKCEELKRVAK